MTMMMSTAPPGTRRKRPRPSYHVPPPSFHVLTDGSEYTGGGGTVFLTIQTSATRIVRYALCGLSELSARLSADQSFALHPTKLVCCPRNDSSLDGLPSLLLTLSQAGAETLTVVTSNTTTSAAVEHICESILTTRAYPQVKLCQVPHSSENNSESCWYEVFQDEYIIVHAKSYDDDAIVLLYTLTMMMNDKQESHQSFAVVPPGVSTNNLRSVLEPLPHTVVVLDSGPESPPLLDFVLLLNPSKNDDNNNLHHDGLTKHVYATIPQNNSLDDGILIRASHQAKLLQPFVSFSKSQPQQQHSSLLSSRLVRLTTGTTWNLGGDLDFDSYKKKIWERCRGRASQGADSSNSNETGDFPEDLKEAFSELKDESLLLPAAAAAQDENEIDIDSNEEEEDQNDDTSIPSSPSTSSDLAPQLLVLGTGCASPSPHRGSSGYALFMPTRDNQTNTPTLAMIALLECGEGTLTNLSRHSDLDLQQQLRQLRFVWISHAHLDHYGGLPSLMRAVWDARCTMNDSLSTMPPVLIIAPAKVLSFLDKSLQVCTKNNNKKNDRWYVGTTHQNFHRVNYLSTITLPTQSDTSYYHPVTFLQNIPVDHCPHAHALLLGLSDDDSNNTNIMICFSGDTRPCVALVDAFNHWMRHQNTPLSLLLHEATFDSDEYLQATTKRHSTVCEALHVASQMHHLTACLLTHFSQRYVKLPPGQNRRAAGGDSTTNNNQNVGFAVDGMRVPLTRAALSNLSRMSDAIVRILVRGGERAEDGETR